MNTGLWPRALMCVVVGYLCMGRSFAYLGFPAWHIFIGETLLAMFLLFGPWTRFGRWPWVARRLSTLKMIVVPLTILLSYGAFEVLHGIHNGNPFFTALRDAAFDYYPIYLFLGIFVGLNNPGLLRRLVRILAWCNGIYGVLYVLFLNRLDWALSGVAERISPVPVFGLPEFSFVVLLALFALEPDLGAVWPLLALNGFVLLGMQIRAEWFAFAVGLLVWGWMTKRLMRMVAGGAVIVVLLVLMALVNLKIPGPATRGGGEISARDLIGRAVAPVDPALAENYTSDYKMDVDTTLWRTVWWAAIWEAVQSTHVSALFGFGYGYPIGDLVPYLQGDFIETPHDVFFYALAYTGWIGVILFALFQAGIGRLLWRADHRTSRPVGLVLWAAMLAYSVFTPFFETPYGAIPFYLLCGLLIAPVLRRRRPGPAPALKPSPALLRPPGDALPAT
jgi:O-Antigen ligase